MTNLVQFPGLGLSFELDRVAFSIGGMNIYWYGVCIAVGMCLALVFAFRHSVEFGVDADAMVDVILIGVVLGIKGEAKGYVTLVLSDKLRTLLKMIPLPRKMSKTPDQVEEFNVYAYVKQLIDGNDVSVLLSVADEVVKVMDALKFYIPTLKDMSLGLKLSLEMIRRYLPEGVFSRIYLDEQPTEAGSYVGGAVALESGDVNTAGMAFFRIKPKSAGVRVYWAQELPASMTAAEAQNYNVTAAERVIPAADISEQISLASKEASGTSNMKFMLNGAPTLGTMDGANVEIVQEVGADNAVIFGLSSDEVIRYENEGGYDPMEIFNNDQDIREVLMELINGKYSKEDPEMFRDIYNSLLNTQEGRRADTYFILKDFCSYADAQKKIDERYRDEKSWAKTVMINSFKAGKFSSDRTIEEYATEIWKLTKTPVKVQ